MAWLQSLSSSHSPTEYRSAHRSLVLCPDILQPFEPGKHMFTRSQEAFTHLLPWLESCLLSPPSTPATLEGSYLSPGWGHRQVQWAWPNVEQSDLKATREMWGRKTGGRPSQLRNKEGQRTMVIWVLRSRGSQGREKWQSHGSPLICLNSISYAFKI